VRSLAGIPLPGGDGGKGGKGGADSAEGARGVGGAWRWPAAAAVAALVLAWAAATVPMMAAGAVLGVTVFLVTLTRPLVVVGIMLAIGALDLSFITGGHLLEDWGGGIDMNGLRLIGMIVAMSAILMVDRSAARHALAPHSRWYILFLVYATLTLAISVLQLDGARLLLKLAYPLLLFLAVLAIARTREELDRLMDWTLLGAAGVALVLTPLLILAGSYEFDAGRLSARAGALHQNPLSFYMLMMMLIAFGRFAVRKQLRYVALAALFAVWLVVSMTRITLLAAGVTFLAVAAYTAWRDRDYRLPVVAAFLLLLVGAPLVPVVLERTFGTIPTVAELMALAADPVALYHRMNLQGRELVWAVAWQSFLANPVFGQGLGTSTAQAMAVLRTGGAAVIHNEYLRLAVDTGLIGIALFAAAMGKWLAVAARAGRMAGAVREFAIPGGAGVIAWAVISLTDNAFDYYASLTQYVAFLVAGAVVLSRVPDPGSAVEAEAVSALGEADDLAAAVESRG
jgi:O-antigen ligase